MKRVLCVLALAGAASAVATGPAVAQEEGIAVGETPEPPVLETLDGGTVDLAGIIGTKPVLVEFWATWCAICRALEPRLRAAHEAYGDRVEFLVVAVGVAQTPERVRQHLARHPAPGRVLWDGRGAAVRAFDSPGTGFIVILDETGRVTYAGTGPDQDLAGALERVVGRGDGGRSASWDQPADQVSVFRVTDRATGPVPGQREARRPWGRRADGSIPGLTRFRDTNL